MTCQVEFERVAPQNTGAIHRVEANIFLKGKLYRAEATENTFELAIDTVKQELDRELSKAQEKRDTLLKRGRRRIKEMLRFGR